MSNFWVVILLKQGVVFLSSVNHLNKLLSSSIAETWFTYNSRQGELGGQTTN